MASRAVQGVLRTTIPAARDSIKQKCLSKKFELPFTFEGDGKSNVANSITTYASSSAAASRQISQQPAATELKNKLAYATVAPGFKPTRSSSSTVTAASQAKFRVPFDEFPTMPTLDNIVEQIESIPQSAPKQNAYEIVGKAKTSEDQLMKILTLGDMRIWQ
jgi:hypothetical protein